MASSLAIRPTSNSLQTAKLETPFNANSSFRSDIVSNKKQQPASAYALRIEYQQKQTKQPSLMSTILSAFGFQSPVQAQVA